MPAAKKTRDLEAEIAFLSRALKAPALRQAAVPGQVTGKREALGLGEQRLDRNERG